MKILPMMLAIASLPLAAHAQGPAGVALPAPPAIAERGNASYVLGPNDEIEVTVFKQPDMTLKTRIKADGTIIAPFLNAVPAAGKTTSELSRQLADRYVAGGFLSSPSINVEVTTYASKTVTVLGAVSTAGLYPLDQPYSVADIIAKAGGTRVDGANAVILTPASGEGESRISLSDLKGAAARLLQPGDKLFVPPAETLFVYGEVNKGGGFPYQPGMTYRQVLALAGGPTLAGSTKRIEVRRKGEKVKAALDDLAQPDDVLVIPEKLF